MNVGPFAPLIGQFSENWRANAPEFTVSITGQELDLEENHPLYGALVSLCSGRSASLPFFAKDNEVVWCTIAPNSDSLREAVASLHAWVLPSFGGEKAGDGYVQPGTATGMLASAIVSVSPNGYYRWRCPRKVLSRVCDNLRLRYSLEAVRPARTRPPRPSLYELRARFAAALLVGDREGAEEIIQLLDSLQLETAVNTQFMRIRLWHHFREYERIRTHPDLPLLVAQPLPPSVRAWIDEALQSSVPVPAPAPEEAVLQPEPPSTTIPAPEEPPPSPGERTWEDWFKDLRRGDQTAAGHFLAEHAPKTPDDLPPAEIRALVAAIEELYLDDALQERERDLVAPGIAEFLEEFVREQDFPRVELGDLYLALLRLWSALYAGAYSSQPLGHVLLELAGAALALNRAPADVLLIIEEWWKARPSRSQLPFALDAIELLEREYPHPEAPTNLWFSAADVILRSPDALVTSEKVLWRRVGKRLGIDDPTIEHYVPPDFEVEDLDALANAKLRHVAIVCMREPQAREAAEQVAARSGAEVTLVTGKSAGAETDHARTADVILFVWMATSHAVFRAFDGVDRKRIGYVQGTGVSSIVRALERWAHCNNG